MQKNFRRILILLVAVTLVIGILAVAQAAPGNGKGKGTFGKNCKKCPPAPAGCEFFECDVHFCNYGCADGTSVTLPK